MISKTVQTDVPLLLNRPSLQEASQPWPGLPRIGYLPQHGCQYALKLKLHPTKLQKKTAEY